MQIALFRRFGGSFALLIFAALSLAPPATAIETVALKKYPHLALPVPNPMVVAKLPYGKTYQVTHPQFVLQFFGEVNLIGRAEGEDGPHPSPRLSYD